MKKISDLVEKVKDKTQSDIWNAAHVLGTERYEDEGTAFNSSRDLKDSIGLCANCKNLNYCRTEWGNIFARCFVFDITLPYGNRMAECTKFDEKGVLSLHVMIQMAVLIDLNKTEIGLLAKNEDKK